MKQKLRLFMSMLLMAVCGVTWGQATLTQLQSIDDIDEDASYVLGIDGTGFHYEGTSSWGKTALLTVQTPLFYTLTIAEDGESFTAKTVINETTYYLQIPTSNTFSMATSPGTNTDIIIGTTQVSGENYAVANKNTTNRHLRINGTSGLRSYAGTTGTMAYFYKYSETTTPSISFETKSVTIGTSSTYIQTAQTYNADNAEVTYSSDNTDVATVNESTGEVSAGTTEGSATITASMTVDDETYTDTYDITVISIEDGVFDFALGYDYGSGLEESTSAIHDESTWTAGKVTLKPTGNYALYTDHTLRIYSGGSFTVFVPEGYEITKIVFLGSSNLNKMSPDSGELTGTGTESTWTGKSQIITFTRTTNNPQYSKITVSYQEKSNEETATVEISRNELIIGDNEANSATITTDPVGLHVVYESSDDEIATVSDEGVVTATGAGTANITVSWVEQTVNDTPYAAGSKVFSVTVTDPNAPGTENNPYTVAQARNAIEDGTGVTGVYAKGIVSEIVTPFNSQYGNISYNISEDGSTTSDQLQAFRGKSYNGEVFTSEDDIQVGDEVVIYGNLKKYNDTYEFDAGNQLVSLERPVDPAVETTTTIDATGITNTDVYTSTTAGTLTATVMANNQAIDGATVAWSSSNENVATVDANGAVTLVGAGTATITASYAGVEDEYKPSSATYELTVTNNDPNAPGTANTPYTVDQARAAIDAGTGITEVYATGIVSEIVTAYNSQYGNISYNISADGSTTGNQLLAYRGKSYNGEVFTSEDDIQVGDEVVIYGNLKKHNDTYEFDAGNQLVSLERPVDPAVETTTTIDATGITNTDVYTSTTAGTLTATVIANNQAIDGATVAWSSSNENVATVDANGTVTLVGAGTATITASYAGVEDEYKPSSATYELTVTNSKPVDPSTEETIIEDFEKQTPSQKYNETHTYTASDSNCGIGWEMYYGSVSTNDIIEDTNNAQMRLYSSQPETYPYIKTTTPIEGLTNIKFKARVSNTDIKFNLSASTDGTTWSTIATDLQLTETGSQGVTDFNYDIPSGNQYIMISISTNTSKPTSGNVKLGIDNVQFTSSISEPTDPDVTFASENISVNIGATAQNEITGPSGLSYTYSSGKESIATVDAATGVVTGVTEGETTITATWESTNRYNAGSVFYIVTVENKQEASATISETNLDTEEVTNATITTIPANLVVEYSSSDTGVATVEGGIVTAVAAGNTTISVTWDEQTVDGTVYVAGSETFNVVVAVPIQCVFEESYGTRFDFKQNGWGFPVKSGNKIVEENSFRNSGKTIKVAGSTGNGYYFNDSNNYLMLGKEGAYITLPAFDYDVLAIEVTEASGTSVSTKQNIFVDGTAVSKETAGKGTNTYLINSDKQSAGTVYTLKLTSDYNAQIEEIKVYKKSAFAEFAVTDAGYRTYCSADALDFTTTIGDATPKAYIVEGVDAEGSTNLVLKEVGKVPTETGVLIEAEEGTYYVARLSAETEEGATVYDDVSTNKLIGVIAPTEVDPSIIVLMDGENGVGFYKTSKTFTVGANTAYLPLRTLETVASAEGDGVKLMNLYGNDDDTPTGITVISASELSGKESVIYNLSGQRVSRAVKGLYIVNGKKVMVK